LEKIAFAIRRPRRRTRNRRRRSRVLAAQLEGDRLTVGATAFMIAAPVAVSPVK